jgi:hypothetical protein
MNPKISKYIMANGIFLDLELNVNTVCFGISMERGFGGEGGRSYRNQHHETNNAQKASISRIHVRMYICMHYLRMAWQLLPDFLAGYS